MVPIVSMVGRHNSGKTTLLTEVIPYLKRAGCKTAVIKHAAHGLNIESRSDSDRLYNSGADLVYASSPGMSLLYRRYDQEEELATIYAKVSPGYDLVICEGFKKAAVPKIEVLRAEISTKPMDLENVIARVADFNCGGNLPNFLLNQYEEVARFIINTFNLKELY